MYSNTATSTVANCCICYSIRY